MVFSVVFIVVIGVVGISSGHNDGNKSSGLSGASYDEGSGPSYDEVRNSFESWDSTVRAYVVGGASLSDLRAASDSAAQDARGYDRHRDSVCSAAIDAYASEIDIYASAVGSGVETEGYARTAQAGQHMEEVCV